MLAERRTHVAGVVLAAGSATRMGSNKLLLPLDGEPLIRRVVRQPVEAGLEPVVVVLGHEARRVADALGGLPCRPVINAEHQRGVNRSLRTGIDSLPDEVAAAIVMLADMPFVTRDMLATLVARYRASAAPLVVSEYAGVSAPPLLYDRSLFPELGMSDGEGCGKRVVRRHRHEAVTVTWPASALTDLDVPEDYERVKAVAASR